MTETLGEEYPKAMYRDGGSVLIWGKPVETRIVDDAEAEREAREEGWRLHPLPADDLSPLDHDGDGVKGGSLPKRRGRPPKAAE